MKLLELQWAKVLVAKVYVDDLTLIVQGKREMMVRTLAMILNFVVAHLEGTLLMQFSKQKSMSSRANLPLPSPSPNASSMAWLRPQGTPRSLARI